MVIILLTEHFAVWVISVSIKVGVGDHGALQVESPVPEVDQVMTVLHVGRGAAQHLSGTQRLCLGNLDVEARLSEVDGGGLEGGHELDGAHQAQLLATVQVALQGLKKMEAVEFNV